MTTPFDYIQQYPERTKSILGIDYNQFQELSIEAKLLQMKYEAEIEKDKKYINRQGGGRRASLSVEEEICLCIFYLRQLPTFEVLGMQFGISKSRANSIFHYWLKILEQLLPPSLIEQFKKKLNEEEEYEDLEQILSESRLIVDSFEQAIERPEDYPTQKEHYSGKKKMHTLKNQVIVSPEGKDIIDIEIGNRGPKSDISIFREQSKKFPVNQMFDGDKAYVGGVNIATPHKKPRNGELTSEQKEENKEFSSNRIFVEHVINTIKIFRIASLRWRLNKDRYKRVISVVCGLVRLRKGTIEFNI
jgi:DDE superfamily endonuclease/Helix-turn-helix of DDE superfamily endonuclease